jgi:ABC-type multidrug transport system fused ATPase/permease subunit
MTSASGTANIATTSVEGLLDTKNHEFELRGFNPVQGVEPADGVMLGHDNTEHHRLNHRTDTISMSQECRENLLRLASQVSQKTHQGAVFEIGEDDAALDPGSVEFDLEKWLRHVIQGSKSEGIRIKSSGTIFKKLRVTGTGSALMLQETVGDLLVAPLRIGELFKGFKSEPKTILADFNGLVKSGEMLLVLGRPGSGCSTFLKSLAGELHGLNLDPTSVIHYDGIIPST